MNIRSILTRGHWLKTSEGKYGLIFLEAIKDKLILIYLLNEKVTKKEVTMINMKYDRVTEKYYLQYTPDEYMQLQLLRPEEHRVQLRILKTAIDLISNQVVIKSDFSTHIEVKQELIRQALQSTTKANQPVPEIDKIGFYYLGKAVYLGLQYVNSKEILKKQIVN